MPAVDVLAGRFLDVIFKNVVEAVSWLPWEYQYYAGADGMFYLVVPGILEYLVPGSFVTGIFIPTCRYR